ncbi:MAG: diadenylate cyclase [Thermoguttaceae bacterium]
MDAMSLSLRPADVLDIGVVTLLVHFTLTWLRRQASRATVLVLGLLALLYLSANRLDMVVTSTLFQLGFTVMLFGLIVVYQGDIRRFLERWPSWSMRRPHDPAENDVQSLDALTESITGLAQDRIGALVVIAGRESIERHVQGGVQVDAKISLPLLHSIFHPASPGHDGAVLLEGSRIQKLGVQLPLSKNLEETGDGGTRHAAALGLAERSDALVVAVSEERGTISLAEHGRLTQVEPGELKSVLKQRWPRQHPAGPPGVFAWRTGEILWKLTALGLALLVWSLLASRSQIVQRVYAVPIEYRHVPPGQTVHEAETHVAAATFSGPEQAFLSVDPQSLVLTADVRHLAAGAAELVALTPPDDLPTRVTVVRIHPDRVRVTLAPLRRPE